jgi:archaellum component FlaF (FlaF/FlaG flagellin family)
LHVKTALAAGETWDAAYSGGATQAIAANQAVAQNTNVNQHFVVNTDTDIASSTTNVAITKNGGGSFTAQGTIEAVCYAFVHEAWTAE